MSKRRVCLIWLLSIILIIYGSTHTSLGQEEDLLNISYPSTIPTNKEVTHENILNQAQRSLDMSINLLNTVGTVMGIFVGLISILLILGGIFSYIEISRFKELNNKAEIYVEQIENKLKDAEKMVDEFKEVESVTKPVRDRLILMDKNTKKSLEALRERAKDLPSLSEPFTEDQKRILDEYGKKTEFAEAFGVPLESEDFFNRGNDFYQENKYDLALKAYDEAIELNPDYAKAWNNKGVTLDKLSRYDEALTAYNKAIELKHDYDDAWNNKGAALAKLDRHEEALEAYGKAIELKPDFARAWYNKACAYSLKGDKENTLKNLSKATDLNVGYKEMAKKDADFKNIWADEDFKRIVSLNHEIRSV